MSKPLSVIIPHNLGAAEARRRLEEGLAVLGKDLPGGGLANIRQHWNGDRMDFAAEAVGQHISGVIDILDDKVQLEIVLPGFLGMIAGSIKRKIEDRGQLLLK